MKNLTLILLATAGVLAGCSKNETPEMPETPRDGIIRIASAIDATGETKAAMVNGTALTNVRFLRQDQASATAPVDFTNASVLTASRAGTGADLGKITFTPSAPLYDLNDNNVFFAAYWPAVAGSVSEVAKTSAAWTVDAKTDILLTDVYKAGKYSAPITGTGSGETAMTFKHQLAQLEVICKADPASTTAESVVQAAWGTITKIELLETAKTVTYKYVDQTIAFSTFNQAILLLQADYTTTFPGGVAILKTPNPAITAAGMFAPKADGNTDKLKLKVYTTKVTGGKEVEVQLTSDGTVSGTAKGFTRGLKHTVTLVFKADDKEIGVLGTSITAWGAGFSGSGDLTN